MLTVPLPTLQRRTENGGLGLFDVATKCRTLSNQVEGPGGKGGNVDWHSSVRGTGVHPGTIPQTFEQYNEH